MIVVLLCLFVLSTQQGYGQSTGPVLVTAERMIDGLGRLSEPGAVLLEGERIVAVGASALERTPTQTIELGDATLLPG
ncbi:MAG: amidohydrolase family protein, partial [Rhodothermales bacterium]|nr:amidohydrolase family protein [Rhodothermales bacterium]